MATEAPAAAAPAAPGNGWEDPYRAFDFLVEISGISVPVGHFAECSGLGMKINVLSYREGGNNQITHRIPGALEHAAVTLRGGITSSTVLFDWMQSIAKGNIDRRNMSVVMLKSDGHTEALRWNLQQAWPSEWCCAPFNAAANELAIQTITIVFESIERPV